jgi:hypothetical protein
MFEKYKRLRNMFNIESIISFFIVGNKPGEEIQSQQATVEISRE